MPHFSFSLIFLIILLFTLLCDYLQTMQIAKNPQLWYEKWNCFLSPHPLKSEVNIYFGIVLLFTLIAYAVLPKEIAIGGCVFFAALEMCCIVNNYRIGIRLTKGKF